MLNSGDTGFMMIATALVFFMTPGLAFFYGGLVRRKNVLNTMISSFFIMGLAAAMWVFFGYSLSFSGDFGGIIGSLKQVSLSGLGAEPGAYADTIPATLFVAFQMMFAIITPALITGSVAGRMKFKALFAFIALWLIVVYYPMAHMVWGKGGFLGEVLGSAETLDISVPVSAAWFFLFYLANAVDMRKRHIVHTTFHLFFWEHRFYGLAGLVSMPEALSQQTDLRFMHS